MRFATTLFRGCWLTLAIAVVALYGPWSAVGQQELSPDGKTFVATAGSLTEAEVRLLNAQTGELRRTQKARMAWITSAVFSPDGKRLAIGGGNLYHGDVEVVDAGSGKSLWLQRDVGKHHEVCLAFSADGKTLCAGTAHGPAKVFDAETGRLLHTLEAKRVAAVAFSPDGKRIAVASLGSLTEDKPKSEVTIWDAEAGKMLRVMPGAGGPVAFSADSTLLATAGADDLVSLWEASSGKLVRTLKTEGRRPRPGAIAFSPDGKLLATVPSTGPLHLWDPQTGKLLKILGDDHVGRIAFSPDSKTIVSWSGTSGLRRWDVSQLLKKE